MLGIVGFARVNLPVSDLARAREFYERVCGLRLVADFSDIRAEDSGSDQVPHLIMAGDHISVALYQSRGPGEHLKIAKNGDVVHTPRSRTRVLHHAFRVSDREALLRQLEEMGYSYEYYEGRGSGGGEVYVTDPDGNRIEFVAHK